MKENQVYRDLSKDVIAAQNNDRDAQDRIILCVRDMVYYTCLKMLRSEDRAMDATQDITMTIYERIGTLKDPTAYVGWVRRITANYCKNALCAKNIEFLAPKTEDDCDPFAAYESLDEQNVPEKVLEQNETQELIRRVIDELPDEQRLCVLMHYFHEMKTREIAETLGVSEGTVKSRLNYARKAIRTGLEHYEKKGFRLCSMLAVPFFGKLLASLKVTAVTATGIAAASAAAGSSFMSGAAQKLVAGLVATMLIGGTTGIVIKAGRKNTVKADTYQTQSVCSVEPILEENRVEEVLICPGPDEKLLIPAFRYESSLECVQLTDRIEETGSRVTSWIAPSVQVEEPAVPEKPDNGCSSAENAPAIGESNGAESMNGFDGEMLSAEREWSAWSMELPPESSTEVRTKPCYRLVTIRKTFSQDPDANHGKASVPTFEYTYGDWSDEPVELTVLIDAETVVETATFYSYR